MSSERRRYVHGLAWWPQEYETNSTNKDNIINILDLIAVRSNLKMKTILLSILIVSLLASVSAELYEFDEPVKSPCPGPAYSPSFNAMHDAVEIAKFMNLDLNDEQLAEWADIIEKKVYPRYEIICDFAEYTRFMFGHLGLGITDEQISEKQKEIDNVMAGHDDVLTVPPTDLTTSDLTTSAIIENTADGLIGDAAILMVFVDIPGYVGWTGADINYAKDQVRWFSGLLQQRAPEKANLTMHLISYTDVFMLSSDPFACTTTNCKCNTWMNDPPKQLGFTDDNGNGLRIDEMSNDIMNEHNLDRVVTMFMVKNLVFFGEFPSFSCDDPSKPVPSTTTLKYLQVSRNQWR